MDFHALTSSTGLWILAAPVIYTVALCCYRIFLDPLRKYPGPLLAKITDAYSGYYAVTKSLPVQTRLDHLEYGPVVRMGPKSLVFSSIQAIHDVYQNDNVSKSRIYENNAVVKGVWHVFNVIDKGAHRVKRRLVGKVLSDRSLSEFEPTMLEQIDVYLDVLSNSKSQVLNTTELIKRLGTDIVCLLAFGYPINTQNDPTNRHLIEGQIFGSFLSNVYMQFPRSRLIGFEHLVTFCFSNQTRQYWGAIERMITSRLAEDKHIRNDLYSVIADEMNPDGEYQKDSEIWAEAAFFLPAGGDTTGTVGAAVLFYLTRYPEAYEKLASEIRTTFQSEDEIKGGPKLASCKYLRACLDETLRISPPAGGTLWREYSKDASGPWVVDGHVIPDGVKVGVNTYALLHNEEYFTEPFVWRPERWENPTRVMTAAFLPFSVGSRTCAGKAMAYLSSSLTLAKTLWRFDFEAAPGEAGRVGGGRPELGPGRDNEMEFQLYDIMSASHVGPNLIFHPRVAEN